MTHQKQHYRMTIDDAVNDYANGLLTAKGAIAAWVRINLAPGWKRAIVPSEIREMFKRSGRAMPRSTFWEALHKLAEDGLIEFAEPSELEITRKADSSKSGFPDVSEKPDSQTENRTAKRKTGQPNGKPDKRSLKGSPNKGLAVAPNSFQIYSYLLQIEEEEEREKIKKYCDLISKQALPSFNRVSSLIPDYWEYIDYISWIDRYSIPWCRNFVSFARSEISKLINGEGNNTYPRWKENEPPEQPVTQSISQSDYDEILEGFSND